MPQVPCLDHHSRAGRVRAMVYLTWAFLLLSWCAVLQRCFEKHHIGCISDAHACSWASEGIQPGCDGSQVCRLRLLILGAVSTALPMFNDVGSWRWRVRLLMAACLRGSNVRNIRQQLRSRGCACWFQAGSLDQGGASSCCKSAASCAVARQYRSCS